MENFENPESKILQVVTGILEKNGGPIKSALTLHKVYLDSNATILTIGPNDSKLVDKIDSSRILALPSIFRNEYGISLQLIQILRIIRSKTIIIHHGFYLASLIYSLLFVRKNSKVLILAHGSFQRFSRYHRRILKNLFILFFKLLSKRKISIRFVAMTVAEVSDIRDFFPDSDVVVSGLGFDLDVDRKESTDIASPTLLCLSRITQKKRIDLCIKSLAIVKHSYPHIRLVIAGSGKKKLVNSLSKLVMDLHLRNHVEFVGHISEKGAFEKLFANSDMLLLPSEDENFALTVAEAIIRGLPVVVSKNVGLSEVVMERNCGLVINSLEEHEVSHAILEVLANWSYYNKNCALTLDFFSHDRVKRVWSLILN